MILTKVPINQFVDQLSFSNKFLNGNLDKTQFQWFLGSLNYVADFIPNVSHICKPLFYRLNKNPSPWSVKKTNAVILLKNMVKDLPCLSICNTDYFMIVETDASVTRYNGNLKQRKTPILF